MVGISQSRWKKVRRIQTGDCSGGMLQDGIAWLVRTDGQRFFSLGVCCVDPGVSRAEFRADNPEYAAWRHYWVARNGMVLTREHWRALPGFALINALFMARWLAATASESLGGIALLAVAQSLSAQELLDVVALAAEKLRPGGTMVVTAVPGERDPLSAAGAPGWLAPTIRGWPGLPRIRPKRQGCPGAASAPA